MSEKFKESSLIGEVQKDLTVVKTSIRGRPNIDHLIKRIIVEKRNKKKKDALVFVFFILLVTGVLTLTLNN